MNTVKVKVYSKYHIVYRMPDHKGSISGEGAQGLSLAEAYPNVEFRNLEISGMHGKTDDRGIHMDFLDLTEEHSSEYPRIWIAFDTIENSYFYYKGFNGLWDFINYNSERDKSFRLSDIEAQRNEDGTVTLSMTLHAE